MFNGRNNGHCNRNMETYGTIHSAHSPAFVFSFSFTDRDRVRRNCSEYTYLYIKSNLNSTLNNLFSNVLSPGRSLTPTGLVCQLNPVQQHTGPPSSLWSFSSELLRMSGQARTSNTYKTLIRLYFIPSYISIMYYASIYS